MCVCVCVCVCGTILQYFMQMCFSFNLVLLNDEMSATNMFFD